MSAIRIGRVAGLTDTGRRRLRNEDAYICEPPLFAVADGMGGARAGEVAAGLAAAALEEADSGTRGAAGIVGLIEEANRRIWERSLADPETAGMGTTVTAALVDEEAGTVAIGHVGDSRAYLYREGRLEQLTTDHSLVAELVESGILTPEEAERHPQRSALTRALGTEERVQVDAFTVDARPGDCFLLCSDGLSTMVEDEEIAAALAASGGDPGRAARALVAAANERGGEDNITVVLFELVEAGAAGEQAGARGQEAPGEREEPTGAIAGAPAAAGEAGERAEQVSKHGAGPGGRLAALLAVFALLCLAALVLYWGVAR